MRSKAACGVVGDQIAAGIAASQAAVTQPGTNFGFTLLGGFLLVFFQVAYGWASAKGYVDARRDRLRGGGGAAARPLAGSYGAT